MPELRRSESWAVCCAVAAAVVVLGLTALTRTPLGVPLEVEVYRDDAYYYFDWVRSVVEGRGPVVGAGAATNGLQVGWAVLLIPLQLVGGSAGLEYGARWLGLVCLGVAGVLLGRALSRAGAPPPLAVLGGLLLVGSPDLWSEAQNGQETAFGLAAIAWLLHERRANLRRFTLAAVLVTLARGDLWLFAAAVSAIRGEDWRRRSLGPGVALAVYFTINLGLAGRPLTDAAEPMAWLFRQQIAASIDGWRDLLGAVWWWGRPVAFGTPFVRFAPVGTAALLLLALGARASPRRAGLALGVGAVAALAGVDDLLALGLAAGAAALGGRGWSPTVRLSQGATALLVAMLALAALHYVVRVYPRPYYFAPFPLLGSYALVRLWVARHRAAPLLVLASLAVAAVGLRAGPERWPTQRAMAIAGAELDRFVPSAAKVGAFNSGIVTWHRHPSPVVNLDGVVNRPALSALQAGRLGAWLDAESIDWLCDNPVQFALDRRLPHAVGAWFGGGFDPARDLVEVARFAVAGVVGDRPGTDHLALYRRRGPVAPASVPAPAFAVEPAFDGHGEVLFWRGIAGQVLGTRDLRSATAPDIELAAAVPGVTVVLAIPVVDAARSYVELVSGTVLGGAR